MKKPKNQRPGTGSPRAKKTGRGRKKSSSLPARSARDADLSRNDPLIEQVRQIIVETPEVRPEKVEPLQEAVESGTYEIDARKVANSLISEILLKR
jgi:negative regulator of flagellin synthesis FlgM